MACLPVPTYQAYGPSKAGQTGPFLALKSTYTTNATTKRFFCQIYKYLNGGKELG